MPKYRHTVTADCYWADVFRTPDKHNIVFTNKPFAQLKALLDEDGNLLPPDDRDYDPLPSYLEPDYEFDDEGLPIVDDVPDDDDEPEATEAASTLAAEYGIDLSTVEGSGKDGTITKGDIQAIIDGEG